MYYNLIQLQSAVPHAIDSVDIRVSVNLLKGDQYNHWLTNDDIHEYLDETYSELNELEILQGTHLTHFFNLPRSASILQRIRDDDTIRFSFMTDHFYPYNMLYFLSDNTQFSVEAIILNFDLESESVNVTRYQNRRFGNRVDVTKKQRGSKCTLDSSKSRYLIPSDPKLWFPDGIHLPIYKGDQLLHRWFRNQSCNLITSEPNEELFYAVYYLGHTEQRSNQQIAEYTGIDLDVITEILSKKNLSSLTEREAAFA